MMASRRRLRRKSCTKKKSYNQQVAEIKSYNLRAKGIQVHAYSCAFTNHWHIGHRPSKLIRLINSRQGLVFSSSIGKYKRL